ncbi:pantetheine-phosphate adenylyltransferase [Halocella sp. SP3-1]|uniref:pantetheine-phosphate adenylyltransferase n=1 Tax=Halocella sp. SP3-1 TaxID=2382161 RepID=UPI000F74C217|nr:pantetheine-phosphate adenylyltransferase [Halocella sp. SP3-1]AZO95235.1 pantetheine-phosphate adenylyltransferase [Halocella sp. SP3-1]
MTSKVVYPGSFDPITNGHLDIIKRACSVFDEVIVAVFHNPQKKPLFSMEEREKFLIEATRGIDNVIIDKFEGLTVDYVKSKKAIAIIRGLRAVSDFEGEFQMASLNKQIDGEVETIFFMTDTKYAFLSSSVIKEVAQFGGNIGELVPEQVEEELMKKYHIYK